MGQHEERFQQRLYTPASAFSTAGAQLIFDIPPFQRDYSWTHERWRDLWRDTCRLASGSRRGGAHSHFLGILLMQDVNEPSVASRMHVKVIDGQQRLLTLSVLLAVLEDEGATLDANGGFAGEHLRWRSNNESTLRTMESIWEGAFVTAFPTSEVHSQLALAYRYFRHQVRLGRSAGGDPAHPVSVPRVPLGASIESWPDKAPRASSWPIQSLADAVLHSMVMVAIHLPADEKEATGVFESLNGRNTPLSEFDKVRVLLYSRSGGDDSPKYRATWLPAEKRLLATSYRGKARNVGDQFLYDFTVARSKEYWTEGNPAAGRTHEVIKERSLRTRGTGQAAFVRSVLTPMARDALLFPLAVADSTVLWDYDLYSLPEPGRRALAAITRYSSGPFTPLLLRTISHHRTSRQQKEAVKQLELIEAFALRITLSRSKLSPLRSSISQLIRRMDIRHDTATLRKELSRLLQDMNIPDDEEIVARVSNTPFYGEAPRSAIAQLLRSYEHFRIKHISNELPLGGGRDHYTIEHIFPQKIPTPPSWRRGRTRWQVEELVERRNDLGNLILLKRRDNSGFGTAPFKAVGQHRRSKLAMLRDETEQLHSYQDITSKRDWSDRHIDARSRRIAEYLLRKRPIA